MSGAKKRAATRRTAGVALRRTQAEASAARAESPRTLALIQDMRREERPLIEILERAVMELAKEAAEHDGEEPPSAREIEDERPAIRIVAAAIELAVPLDAMTHDEDLLWQAEMVAESLQHLLPSEIARLGPLPRSSYRVTLPTGAD
jgi:hypothetical protein